MRTTLYDLENGKERFAKMMLALDVVAKNGHKKSGLLVKNAILKNDDLMILPSVEDYGKYSYSTKPEQNDNNRTKTTLPRIMRRRCSLSSDQISDPQLGDMTNLMNSIIWESDEGHVVLETSGEGIVDVYQKYIGVSCMSAMSRDFSERLLAIYSNNPEKVRIFYVSDSRGRAIAKALVWKTDQGDEILERVYDYESSAARAIIGKAYREGIKVQENPYSGMGDYELEDYTVTVNIEGIKDLPYFDSWKANWASKRDHFLLAGDGVYLNSTEGGGIETCASCGDKTLWTYEEEPAVCQSCDFSLSPNSVKCDLCGDWAQDPWSDNDGNNYCYHCYDTNFTTCTCCRCVTKREDMIVSNGVLVCKNCEDKVVLCECCGQGEVQRYIRVTTIGEICSSCYSNQFFRCFGCDHSFLKEDGQEINGYTYCAKCFSEHTTNCVHCGDLVRKRNTHTTREGAVCEGCFNHLYCRCDDCGEYIPVSEAKEQNGFFGNFYVCQRCWEIRHPNCSICGDRLETWGERNENNTCPKCEESITNYSRMMDIRTSEIRVPMNYLMDTLASSHVSLARQVNYPVAI